VTHLVMRCHTRRVPTTRPRHVITETDALAAALDEAARRWPEDARSRSRLLLRLIEIGRTQLVGERENEIEDRRRAIRETSGILAGAYPAGYLEDLRRDWAQ
jgi:hypothetical protein